MKKSGGIWVNEKEVKGPNRILLSDEGLKYLFGPKYNRDD